MTDIRITEIFFSLQGEGTTAGCPTVFVRLTGCPLRCDYCDTAYAFTGGEILSVEQVLSKVAEHSPQYVCVTGGEPLAQKACLELLRELCDGGYRVSLETSGALEIDSVDPRVQIVMDVKTPDSGEAGRNLPVNIGHLAAKDLVKFVLCSEADYQWAVDFVQRHRLAETCEVLFSPAWQQLAPDTLADWILRDRLRGVRLQLQLHKLLWGEAPGK